MDDDPEPKIGPRADRKKDRFWTDFPTASTAGIGSEENHPGNAGVRPLIRSKIRSAGSLINAMLGLVEKIGSDAQANMASTAEVRKALRPLH